MMPVAKCPHYMQLYRPGSLRLEVRQRSAARWGRFNCDFPSMTMSKNERVKRA